MRRREVALALGLVSAAAYVGLPLGAEDRGEPEQVTLLGTLRDWTYPGATVRGGARMSDGDDPSVADLEMHAVLATPDPVEKVLAYYSEQYPEDRESPADADAPAAAAPSVCVRDDSENRPVTLRVIHVNEDDRSTTLVVSRAAGEAETHIVWTQYRRFPNAR